MGIFSRIFGICRTQPPADPAGWSFDGSSLYIELNRMPELSRPGGAVRVGTPDLPAPVLIVAGEDGAFHAFANRCPHAGRRLDPLPGQPRVQGCSVGNSTFDYDGKRLSGSARADIQTFPVRQTAERLVIQLK